MQHNQQPNHSNYYDDEIDLFELAQNLWEQKWLIIASTFLVTALAGAYAFLATPTYQSSITIYPAKISEFGNFVSKMDTQNKTPIELATSASKQVFTQLNQDLGSKTNIQKFFASNNDKYISISSSIPKGSQNITLTATSSNKDAFGNNLTSYVDFVANITQQELNKFFQNLGTNQTIKKEMIFSLNGKASTPTQVKPKKKLIVAVGFVLGGMLGVFGALLLTAIRNRKKV